MIREENGINILEFGIGDIEVSPGDFNKVPCVCFIQQNPDEIGARAQSYGKYGDTPSFRDDVNTMFTFTKPESVDVVIEALQLVKQALLNENK